MIVVDSLRKTFPRTGRMPQDAADAAGLTILDRIDLHLAPGRFAAIRGPSGCGKSTLLLIIGGLLAADVGTVHIDGHDVLAMDDRARNRFRARVLGFVFQRFHLLPYLHVADNIRVAGVAAGIDDPDHLEALLTRFGLAHRRTHEPGRLSVGEQQRCALARALYCHPRVLLADEPTGNLDPEHAAQVLAALRTFADDGGSVLLVTHDPAAAACADERHRLIEGRLERESA